MNLSFINRPKSLLIFLFILIFLILLGEGTYYWWTVKKSQTPQATSQSYLGEMIATARIEVYLSPGTQKVGYFVPGQKFTPTGEQEGDWIEVIDSDGYKLWIEKNNPSQPAGE